MDSEPPQEEKKPDEHFKRPMLVGKIGKLPKKLKTFHPPLAPVEETKDEILTVETVEKVCESAQKALPYEEPNWSGLPEASTDYVLEVLKNGSIIETVNLMKQPFWVFGRLANCDVCMQHPTISRYHAVLQYRKGVEPGFFIYDLESTHGTFLNKNRIRPRSYVRMHVGHMLKLGCSTRTFILNGPDEDTEEESSLTVTELKQKREQELQQRELARTEQEEKRKKQEERGIDWGLGEDADEETDLAENPYAQTNNEELYLENPKKALRGFFEREGLDLEYVCTEQGMGQFLCKVELPIDDEMGRPIFAEVFHKGKKKEAVIQCALEACRILDRHGLLRQATHESRKRKPKNWEENDYYDSDDDTFLDRTGTVEKKREMRINAKIPQKAETYESLVEKEKQLNESIKKLEMEIETCQKKLSTCEETSGGEVDSLDSFMMELKEAKPSKKSLNKLKSELFKLKQEHGNVIKLVNVAKPASLPPLVAEYKRLDGAGSAISEEKTFPVFGKRKKIKVHLDSSKETYPVECDDDEEEELKEEKTVEDVEEIEKMTHISSKINEEKSEKDEGSLVEVAVEVRGKNKKRNQRRIQQKQEKALIQKEKGYEEDANKEDYNMWVPPNDQTGDGRTALNDKLGY